MELIMKYEDITNHIKNADQNVDIGNGVIQHLKFIPTKDFYEGDIKLFGVKVRQQGRKLIIIIKFYDDGRRKEIISKAGIMVRMMQQTIGHDDIDVIHLIDSKDVLEQMSKYKIDENTFSNDEKIDISIETIDLITGEMVIVDFSMGLMRVKNKNQEFG